MKNNRIIIGIIDSGVDRRFIIENGAKIKKASAFNIIQESRLVECIEYSKKDIKKWLAGKIDHISDEHGHGTSVLSIIWGILPNAEFVVSKVLDHEKKGYSICLVEALRWMIEKTDVLIINISITTNDTNIKDDMLKLVKEAKKKGIVIYSAKDNEYSIPASVDGVVSVTDFLTINKVGQYSLLKSDVVIEKKEELIWWEGEWIQDPIKPSWACAVAVSKKFETGHNFKKRFV